MSRIEGFMQKRTETFSGKASPAWRSGSRSSVAAYLVAAYSDAEAINQPRPSQLPKAITRNAVTATAIIHGGGASIATPAVATPAT